MDIKNKYLKYKKKYLELKKNMIANKIIGGGLNIYLVSKEGDKFQVERNVAEMSNHVKSLLPDDDEEDDMNEEIPLPLVSSIVLAKVIKFCNIQNDFGPMKEIQKPINFNNLEKIVDSVYVKFINDLELTDEDGSGSMFKKLIYAANYLEIKPLLDLLLVKVATILIGMAPEEIHKTFKVKNDFTPEEEEEVKVEGLWKPEDDIGMVEEFSPEIAKSLKSKNARTRLSAMVEEFSPEIAKSLKSKNARTRLSAAKDLLKILNDLKEGEAKKSKETLWNDVVSDLIVPYEYGVIYRPEVIISWWRNTIFPFIGPSSLDRFKLRKLCRLFRDSLIPPIWAKFPHSKYSSLNKMIEAIKDEQWKNCDSPEHLSSLLSKSPSYSFTGVVGVTVKVKWTNRKYYKVKIVRDNKDSTYNIKFNGNNTIYAISWDKIQLKINTSKVPSIIVISDGEHHVTDYSNKFVHVNHTLTIVGESRDKTIIKGGFKLYSDNNAYQFKLENMTITNPRDDGLWAYKDEENNHSYYDYGTRFEAKNLSIRDCKLNGVFCQFPGTFIDCTIENCGKVGLAVKDTEINLKGENTLITRNGKNNNDNGFGIKLIPDWDNAIINIYSPLKLESVSKDNRRGGNWDGAGKVTLKNKEGGDLVSTWVPPFPGTFAFDF